MSEGFVYLLRSRSTGLYKIGMSVNPPERVKQVESEIRGMGWELVAELATTDQRALESAFHAAFAHKRAGRKEWFVLSPADVALFKALAQTGFASPRIVCFDLRPVVNRLKRTGRPLTAVIYQEASSVHLDGDSAELVVLYPEGAAFHAMEGMKTRHIEALRDAISEEYGVRPAVRIDADPGHMADVIRTSDEIASLARKVGKA